MDEHMQSPPITSAPPPVELPKGLAIASMVLGIVSLVFSCCLWPIAGPCAIVGLILGIIACGKAKRGEAGGRGMAIAGVITSSIAIVLVVAMIALTIFGFVTAPQYEMEPYEDEVTIQSAEQPQEGTSAQMETQADDDAPSSQPVPAQNGPPSVEQGQPDAPSSGTED